MPDISGPRIGVGVILWRGERVLLGRRIGDAPCWQFPGGRLETGESVIACARRELLEETGLPAEGLVPAGYTDRQFMVGGDSYITLYVTGRSKTGEARVMEPGKCESWRWFDYRELPSPLFEPISLYLRQHKDLLSACRCRDTPAGGHR